MPFRNSGLRGDFSKAQMAVRCLTASDFHLAAVCDFENLRDLFQALSPDHLVSVLPRDIIFLGSCLAKHFAANT